MCGVVPPHITMARPAKAATSPKPKKVTSPKKRAVRKKKDPKAPKRALSAYMLWLSENRAKLAKPGMTFVEVSRVSNLVLGRHASILHQGKRGNSSYSPVLGSYPIYPE